MSVIKRYCNILTGVIVIISVSCGVADSKKETYLLAGVQSGGLLNTGEFNNEFDNGLGLIGEISIVSESGWSWVIYGTGVYWTKNRAKSNAANVLFYIPYYTEIRKFIIYKSIRPFISIGFAHSRMHFEKTRGWNLHYLVLTGIGAQIRIGEDGFVQMMVKPYRVFNNSLDQIWGIEASISIVFSLKYLQNTLGE